MMKANLVVLAGMGDIEAKCVSDEAFQWLSVGGAPPQCVIDACERDSQPGDWSFEGSGSAENDRAFYVPAIKVGEEELSANSIKELTEMLKKHSIEVDKTYEGMIY